MKTRERILQASLQLFNEQGERAVTTNHIAAYLDMSPGNLYYHFRNKQQIIAELFARYEAEVDAYLKLPEGRPLTLADKSAYLESMFHGLWDYRFLLRDLEHLLDCDAQLAERYRAFSRRCVDGARAIYQGLVEAGILCRERTDPEVLAINSWLLMTSWVSFVYTSVLEAGQALTPEQLRRGVYQVLAQEWPLLSDEARPAVAGLLQAYHSPLR